MILRAGSERSTHFVGSGLLDETGSLLARGGRPGRVAVVASLRAHALFGKRLLAALRRAGYRPVAITVPDGEAAKTPAWLSRLHAAFLDARIDRGSLIVGLGGGATLDLAGFAAATYHRGVPSCLVPTTLLAQVDASVGGKTGVNLPGGKNLVGAVHLPGIVVADVATLESLPDRQFRSGLAEIAKIGAACDRPLFELLEGNADRLLAREPRLLGRVIAWGIQTKCRVVETDLADRTGRRAVLNYGHTVGHALESVLGYRRLTHGEAVAVGVVAAARIAVATGLADPTVAFRQESLLSRLGLPTRIPDGLRTERIARAIGRDKKTREGVTPFVLTPRIGSAKLASYVPHGVLCAVLQELGGVGRGWR